MTTIRTVVAAEGSGLSNERAQTAYEFLQRKFNGDLFEAEDVVAAARPQRSPIHREFEWDDAAAADRYRLEQARHLTRSIIVIERIGDEDVPTRAYHHVAHVTAEGVSKGYLSKELVFEREEYATQVVERAKREFIQWRERYRQYEELSEWLKEQI